MASVRVQLAGQLGADLLQRVVRRRQLGMLTEQPPELVLERVVLGVADRRLARVVEALVMPEILRELVDPIRGGDQR